MSINQNIAEKEHIFKSEDDVLKVP